MLVSRRRVAIAAVLAATALVAGCGDGNAPSAESTVPPTASSAASTTGGAGKALEWQSCGEPVRCAKLDVPLDYDDPTGRQITLALNQRPARKPEERIGSLLVNPGGPGAAGLPFARTIPLPDQVLDRFDVIGFDPRGVGESTAINCGDQTVPAFRHIDSAPDDAAEQSQLDGAAKAVADDCAAHAGDLLPFVGTDSVARDLESIREALGEPQINYYGASYGTFIGERYLALFPKSARAVVLDGVVDPTQDLSAFLRGQAVAFNGVLDVLFAGCSSGSQCPPGGARAAYDRLAAQVETNPIPTRTGDALGPAELPVAALIPAYEPDSAEMFYRGLTEALKGDGTTLYSLFDSYERSGSYLVYAGVECTDSPHPVGADAYQSFAAGLIAASPLVGGSVANELLPCAFWPAPVHDVTGPVVASDGPPVLVVGNKDDAVTPYPQAVDVANTLAHGRLLTLDSSGHTALGRSGCVDDVEAAYFVDLTLPAEGTVCSL
ncbi:MAG TPA: alpha/beta hydrolase [Acidimicrobiales bacterium]|jgi:pimeloyl-ACP methyl ester carboxylesterase|nr:alpha/beta hydrolase [Acidimicrobiales bacterium]